MEATQINNDVLCILKKNEKSNEIEIDYLEIEKDLENEFKVLQNIFEKKTNKARPILNYIIKHEKLKVLLNKYNYCSFLNNAYQGLYSTIEILKEQFKSDFGKIKDIENKEKAIQAEKDKLLIQCNKRLHAYYLEQAYKKCEEDEKVLAFSHRKVGWSAPKYDLNENFSIELKTNFGYGSASYFYCKIKYKDLDIVPFSDWVNYQISRIYEIVQYSSKHRLSNESWQEAMEYVSEACNISLKDEELFIKKYIIDQCEEMITGLDNILTKDTFKLKGYAFLNQERGYIDLKLKEHNLTEFRGAKISGALGLIKAIKQFSHIIEIKDYIVKIESLNKQIQPSIKTEIRNVVLILRRLLSQVRILEPKFTKSQNEIIRFNQKKRLLKKSLIKQFGEISDIELMTKFKSENPNYQKVREKYISISKELHEVTTEVSRTEKTLENLKTYKKTITDYFRKKK